MWSISRSSDRPDAKVNEGRKTNLSCSGLSHQCGELPGDNVTGNIVQQPSIPSITDMNGVIQTFPREGVCHLFCGSQSLLGLGIVSTEVVNGVGSGHGGGLYVFSIRSSGINAGSATLECNNRPHLGEFGAELGDDEVGSKESNAKGDNDAEILVRKESEKEKMGGQQQRDFSPSTCDSTRS